MKNVPLENSLFVKNPKATKEWMYEKNLPLTPKTVSYGSQKIAFFKCSKNSKHIWDIKIGERMRFGCPFCTGKRVHIDDSLLVKRPDLVDEWDYEKNLIKPSEVLTGSDKKIWWICRRVATHKWPALVGRRARRGDGCPHCSSPASRTQLRVFSEIEYIFNNVLLGFKYKKNEIDIFIKEENIAIEVDGRFWHGDEKAKLREIKKNNFLKKHQIKLIRFRESPLEKISRHDVLHDHIKFNKNDINNLIKKIGLLIKKPSQKIKIKIEKYLKLKKFANEKKYLSYLFSYPGPIKGSSLQDKYPEIAKSWHPTKNGVSKPINFSSNSGFLAWWKCKKGHSWEAQINTRTKGHGCNICATKKQVKDSKLKAKKFAKKFKKILIINKEMPFSRLAIIFNKKAFKTRSGGKWHDTTIKNLYETLGIQLKPKKVGRPKEN